MLEEESTPEVTEQEQEIKSLLGMDYATIADVGNIHDISRKTVYNRMEHLQIKPWKKGNTGYFDAIQLAHLQGLHEYYLIHNGFDGYPVPPPSGPWTEEELALLAQEKQKKEQAKLARDEQEEEQAKLAPVEQTKIEKLEQQSSVKVEPGAYSNTPQNDLEQVARRGAERAAAMIAGEEAVVSYLLENPDQLPADLLAQVESIRATRKNQDAHRQQQFHPETFAQMAIAQFKR